jgi:hypothetical protein
MQNMNNNPEEYPHMGFAVAISLVFIVLLMAWLTFTALASGLAIV